MPQSEFTAGLLDDPEETPEAEAVAVDEGEHPDDREAYEEFARVMGWAVEWWELGTDRDIPGPGRLPFVLAFRKVRELMGGPEVKTRPKPAVDHWAEWLKTREQRKAKRRRR